MKDWNLGVRSGRWMKGREAPRGHFRPSVTAMAKCISNKTIFN